LESGLNSDSVLEEALSDADIEDAGPEFFYFFVTETVDGPQLGEVLRAGKHYVAQSGGA
jgi:hypothetical protein